VSHNFVTVLLTAGCIT